MNFLSASPCYKTCNSEFPATDPNRLFCKKACDSDGSLHECKIEFCSSLCVKEELSDSQNYKGLSSIFSRAPGTSTTEGCLAACFKGCQSKEDGD